MEQYYFLAITSSGLLLKKEVNVIGPFDYEEKCKRLAKWLAESFGMDIKISPIWSCSSQKRLEYFLAIVSSGLPSEKKIIRIGPFNYEILREKTICETTADWMKEELGENIEISPSWSSLTR